MHPMFIAVQSTIAKCWKQPKCPSVNEWIKNGGTFTQWNTMQQKKDLLLFMTAWMGLEGIILSDIRQMVKDKCIPYDITYKWNLFNKTNKQAK